jgi:site-specific DNA-methyltransferase (adenine-specific)
MIINGNSAVELKKFNSESIDAVVCDPPYGIEFLAKEWDSNTGAVEIWEECLRVLKPGGHLLAFSAPRKYHVLATNIEASGFEIRDQIMWINSQGFPKAQDIGKNIDRRGGMVSNNKWHGWKTALSPAHEPICLARKPFKGSTIDNVLKHNVGALNIDESRIPYNDKPQGGADGWSRIEFGEREPTKYKDQKPQANKKGTTKGFRKFMDKHQTGEAQDNSNDKGYIPNTEGRFPSNVLGEVEGYQKFFYCPKVSRKERHRGFEQNNIPTPFGDVKGCYQDGERFAAVHQKLQDPLSHLDLPDFSRKRDKDGKPVYSESSWMYDPGGVDKIQKATKLEARGVANNHPTVKPIALMKYLIKLVAPKGSHILDPFAGSGTTGMACKELGMKFTGIDLDKNYCKIAKRRIEATKTDPFERLFNDNS